MVRLSDMITFFALFLGLTVQASFPTFQTCNHEANFGKTKVNGTKIVGGMSANENQWPFIARLTVKFSAGEGLCGGTIIDNNWVLTFLSKILMKINQFLALHIAVTEPIGFVLLLETFVLPQVIQTSSLFPQKLSSTIQNISIANLHQSEFSPLF